MNFVYKTLLTEPYLVLVCICFDYSQNLANEVLLSKFKVIHR